MEKAQKTHYKFMKKQTSKMGKIAHFSTDHTTCFRVCSYCYGKKAVNMYKATKRNYENNTKVLNGGGSLPDIPKNADIVRMYVNGDFHTLHVINQWYMLARKNPQVKFFGYTKQWQNRKLLSGLEKLKQLPNVVLRASVDCETGYNIPKGWSIAGIYTEEVKEIARHYKLKHYVCKFSKNKIKCDSCKICFKSKLSHYAIFFPYH